VKLSKETIKVLQNFATISPGIIIAPGSKLKIVAKDKILAMATIAETFEEQVSIYDLPQFLNIISMFEDPILEFNGRMVIIRQDSTRVTYTYADPAGISKMPDEIRLPPQVETFVITAETLKSLKRACGIMGLPNILIKGDSTNISLIGTDADKSSTNTFNVNVGETLRTFQAGFDVGQFKQLDYDYQVVVTTGLTHFSAIVDPAELVTSVDYWLPHYPNISKFN
jgi:hypothetical protein